MKRDLGSRPVGDNVSRLESWELVIRHGSELRTEQISSDKEFLDAHIPKKYPAKQHALKSAKELGVDEGLIYLPGQMTLEYEDSDMGPNFRQRKYFFYITGVDIADCDVTYEISTSTLILWIPRIEPREALYFGAIPDSEELKRRYDVDDVRYSDELNSYVRKHSLKQTLYLLHDNWRYRSTALSPAIYQSAARIDSSSLKPAMDRARLHKDPHEIALIRRACQISATGHRLIAQRLLSCSNEREIHALFTGSCIARAAPAMAYEVIAGAGVNASTLHYIQNDADLAGNDVVLVDAGCEYKGYASDITRTLPVRGKFEGKAKAIYDLVEEMQEACLAAAKVGKYYYELQVLAADVALDGLLKLGILRGDRDKIRWQGTVAAFFPHGLGHHVGLEVHDVDAGLLLGGVPSKSSAKGKRTPMSPQSLVSVLKMDTEDVATDSRLRMRLEPNMVLTVEPGVYFCRPYIEPWLLAHPEQAQFIDRDVLDEYYPVGGVRIEDVILVTEDGIENLSKDAPKGKELEDVINGRA